MRARDVRSWLLVALLSLQTACGGLLVGLDERSAQRSPRVSAGFNLFSPEQDIELGRLSAEEVARQLPLLRDERTARYVQRLGERLAAKSLERLGEQSGERTTETPSDHPDPASRVAALDEIIPTLRLAPSPARDTDEFRRVKSRLAGMR